MLDCLWVQFARRFNSKGIKSGPHRNQTEERSLRAPDTSHGLQQSAAVTSRSKCCFGVFGVEAHFCQKNHQQRPVHHFVLCHFVQMHDFFFFSQFKNYTINRFFFPLKWNEIHLLTSVTCGPYASSWLLHKHQSVTRSNCQIQFNYHRSFFFFKGPISWRNWVAYYQKKSF